MIAPLAFAFFLFAIVLAIVGGDNLAIGFAVAGLLWEVGVSIYAGFGE